MSTSVVRSRYTSWIVLEWQRLSVADEVREAMASTLPVLRELAEDAVLGFELSAGGARRPTAGFFVTGPDRQTVEATAEELVDILRHSNPWQRYVVQRRDSDATRTTTQRTVAIADLPNRSKLGGIASAWKLAAERPTPTVMRIDFGNGNRSASTDDQPRCHLTLSGETTTVRTVWSLMGLGSSAVHREVVETQNRAVLSPTDVVADLVSTPASLPDIWCGNDRAFHSRLRSLTSSTPPHSVWFGGSGQGKTTLMEHLIDRSLTNGETVVVCCPHGDLANRAAHLINRSGRPADVYAFGDRDEPPRWNLCEPPIGVARREWPHELYELVRDSWGSVPGEWFGPVGQSALVTALSLAVRDTFAGSAHPITEVADILRPASPDKWHAAARRVGDEQLLRRLRDLWQLFEKDRDGHAGIWVASKVEPFARDPRARAILGSYESTVDPSGPATGRSLIASVPAGQLGDAVANLILGSLLAQVWHRRRQNPDWQKPIAIYVDEAQRVPVKPLREILSEGRKFGVNLHMAAQGPSMLSSELLDVALTNCGVVGAFRVGTQDARTLAPLFSEVSNRSLAQAPTYFVNISLGPRDLQIRTLPPLVKADDDSALMQLHKQTAAVGRARS